MSPIRIQNNSQMLILLKTLGGRSTILNKGENLIKDTTLKLFSPEFLNYGNLIRGYEGPQYLNVARRRGLAVPPPPQPVTLTTAQNSLFRGTKFAFFQQYAQVQV